MSSGQVFHVSDDADTTLGDLAEIIADLFEIKYKFVGKMLSTLAKVCMYSIDIISLQFPVAILFNY